MARLHLFVIITTIDIYIIYFLFNWTPVQIFATFAFCNRIEGCVGGLIGGDALKLIITFKTNQNSTFNRPCDDNDRITL